MHFRIAALFLALPVAAQAADRTFYCTGGEGGKPEVNVVLVQYDGQDKGHIALDGQEISASAYSGPGSIVFVALGDGYALTYALDTESGFLDYSATGSRSGIAQAACSEG